MAVRFADAVRASFTPAEGPKTGLLAGVGAAAIAVAARADPATIESGPVICPFRLLTGLPCPGCGLTRSWVYLLHGDTSAAMTANPFGVVALCATLVLVVAVLGAVVRRQRVPSIGGLFLSGTVLSGTVRSRIFVGVAALWIVFGFVRLVAVATGAASA